MSENRSFTPEWKSGRPPKAGVYETRVLNLPDQIYYARWWQDQWLSDRATPDEAAQQIHPSMMTEREWRGEPMEVKAVPSERGDNWIRCFDRLPETPGTSATRVLAWIEHDGMGWIAVRFYNNRKWWANGDEIYGENITHWMPLPEPPK